MKDAWTRFELWLEDGSEPPPRSRLYNLEPVGIGTPEVERLSGYVNRLAQAHCVRVSALFKHAILPHLTKSRSSDKNNTTKPTRWLPGGGRERLARMIDGTGMIAERWVKILEALTGRRDLRFLTLLEWRDVLPKQLLFSPLIRWCPACFDAWLSMGQPIYDPLLWKLNPITSCLLHRRKLRSRCHQCHQQQGSFMALSRPGFCSRCGALLGCNDDSDLQPEERLNEDEWQWQNWAVKNLGQLLRAAPRLDRPPPMETVARSIAYYLSQRADSGLAKLSEALGIRQDYFRRWAQGGRSRMRIDLLLKFCFHYGISLVAFLTEPSPAPPSPLSSPSQKQMAGEVAKANRHYKGANREELRRVMESALEIESPLLSLQAVAKQLKLASRTLLYHEPELCRQIVARGAVHREQINERVRSTLEQSLEQDHLPALKELAKRNGFSASLARKRHPDLWAEIAARRRRQKKQAWESVRQELEKTLCEENPLPTVKMIAARFGCNIQTLYRYFPDLYHEIVTRRAEQQQACFLNRREELFKEIRETVLKLHAQGIFPSAKRVSKNLPIPRNIDGNEQAMSTLRQIRKELGWE
jgi:DNA-binding transcriptional regulator YhcF (GntR family)/transcriptional regulator with XRE-family HTH domain